VSAKRLHTIFAAVVLAALAALAPAEPVALAAIGAPAGGGAALSEAYAWERFIDVFIAGDMNPESLSCRVSNQAAEVVGRGLLADQGVTVRTTILLDVSASMPSQARESVRSYIGALIEGVGKNEQYRLATFGERLSVLQDFTSDRYDLAAAASGIEFGSQQSRLYDAVYSALPEGGPIGGSPCYYRTVLVTDGADDAASGITKEELYLKLQASAYPIDVVAVSKASQAEPDKELSALTRMSGGRYANLSSETDAGGLASSLGAGGVIWLRAVLPDALLDGSTRQFDITDGAAAVRFDFKVPVYDAPAAEPGASQEAGAGAAGEAGAQAGASVEAVAGAAGEAGTEAGAAGQPEAGAEAAAGAGAEAGLGASEPGEAAPGAEPESQLDGETGDAGEMGGDGGESEADGANGANDEDGEDGEDETGSRSGSSGRGGRDAVRSEAYSPMRGLPFYEALGEYAAVVYIGAGIVAILMAAGIVAFVVIQGRNKKGRAKRAGGASGTGAPNAPGAGGSAPGAGTEIIVGGPPGGAAAGAGALCARLRNVNNPDQIWNVGLPGGALVGRDTGCQVCVADGSMSRQQCRLSVGGDGIPIIENLSSSNITLLNGEPLGGARPIKEGDRLKCGRVTLMVDSLYRSDSGSAGSLNKQTEFANV
jgi:hypothetical protein